MEKSLGIVILAAFSLRAATLPSEARTFLDKNCAGCHQSAKAPAGFDLKTMAFDLNDAHLYSRWVRVHDAVQKGVMPPAGLSAPERAAFLKMIGEPLTAHERERAVTQGRSVLRRLNRYEYESTLRDLFGAPWLQLKDSLPEDGVVNRFNKVGQGLDISHVQMARYMETAEQSMRLVLKSYEGLPESRRLYAREQTRMVKRMTYSPFNTSPERVTIPILGFEAQPDVIHGKAPVTVGDKDPKTRDLEGYATPASTYTGNEMSFSEFSAPVGGTYRLRMNAFSLWIHTQFEPSAGDKKVMAWRPNREKTEKGKTTEPVTLYALSRGGEKRLLGTFDVSPDPAVHELTVHLLPGEQIMPDASRLFRSRPGWTQSPDTSEAGTPGVAYRWLDVEGPLPVEKKIFLAALAKKDGTVADAERLLRPFVSLAYRRPARDAEVARYLKIVQDRLAGGFSEAMLAGYTAVLCSPGFIYLEETPGPLNDYALASRLSYFLWNTAPDQELRELAAKGMLRKPGTLRVQTRRLLDNARSREFVNAFLDYWLDMRKMADTTPDVVLYPETYLDDLLVESSLQETQMFVDRLIRKNLPVSNLIDSKWTLLNSHLARHYGVKGVEGSQMRYVELPEGSVRGGLLTQASVLKVTANGTTTSPVLRGVWIQERIMGDPPPPPPPGVPAVEPDTRGATTIRQQLDKHRASASCAACHSKIDPPGFALESFDVVGAWRDRYRSTEEGEAVKGYGKNGHTFAFRLGKPVDASGKLPSGESFQDVVGLKKALLKDERQVARNMLTQLVAYGTGAPASFGDRGELDRILKVAEKDRYGVRTLIEQIVESKLFLNK